MRLVLTALHEPLAAAWQRFCGDLPFVQVHRGSIFDAPCDAVVSPANSFGFMNGGIDLFYSRRFGWHVQDRVQSAIRERHHGELLVGQAEIVATDDTAIPYLIAAPTMRMPQTIRETVNPYLAARAVFLLWKHGRFPDGPRAGEPLAAHIETVAMPGLGTGVGSVDDAVCARQVRAALDDVLLDQFTFPPSWVAVLARHEAFLGHPLTNP
ncbi:MAG TPA: macro domain-containing protein [Herpetosiphonaceae bacterium]|nr:macro domain-containing protein [Herpetosiphonaceae bacterium]